MAESGDINETMKQVQDRLNKSKYYQLAKNRFTQDRERLMKFLSTYGIYVVLVALIVATLIIYFNIQIFEICFT